MDPRIGGILFGVCALIVVQLHGVMGFFGVKLSAIPAIITVLAVGLGAEFVLHIIIVSLVRFFLGMNFNIRKVEIYFGIEEDSVLPERFF